MDSSEQVRNWVDLPYDVLSLIFTKLGAIEILARAQWVCSKWRSFSKEPHLFRSVDLQKWRNPCTGHEYVKEELAREAVDRSCGQLIEFSIANFATNHLLQYVAEKSSSLKCLRLVSCQNLTGYELIEMVKKTPHLEELEICLFVVSKEVIEALGRLLPGLKSFRYNHVNYYRVGYSYDSDEEAVVIAGNMHELRSLNLVGNRMRDNGVRAILDGCPHLESLDLRKCVQVELAGDLEKRFVDGNIQLRRPDDPMDDFEFFLPDFHVYLYSDDEDDDYADHDIDDEFDFDYDYVDYDTDDEFNFGD